MCKFIASEFTTIEREIGLENTILSCGSTCIDRNAKDIGHICGWEPYVLSNAAAIRRGFTNNTRKRCSTDRSLWGPPSTSKQSSYTRMGASPECTVDWKNSIPSSAGVFGVTGDTGVVADEPPEEDFELDEGCPPCLFFGIIREGLAFPYELLRLAIKLRVDCCGGKEETICGGWRANGGLNIFIKSSTRKALTSPWQFYLRSTPSLAIYLPFLLPKGPKVIPQTIVCVPAHCRIYGQRDMQWFKYYLL